MSTGAPSIITQATIITQTSRFYQHYIHTFVSLVRHYIHNLLNFIIISFSRLSETGSFNSNATKNVITFREFNFTFPYSILWWFTKSIVSLPHAGVLSIANN